MNRKLKPIPVAWKVRTRRNIWLQKLNVSVPVCYLRIQKHRVALGLLGLKRRLGRQAVVPLRAINLRTQKNLRAIAVQGFRRITGRAS